jgi:hypothetical protein
VVVIMLARVQYAGWTPDASLIGSYGRECDWNIMGLTATFNKNQEGTAPATPCKDTNMTQLHLMLFFWTEWRSGLRHCIPVLEP